MKVVNLKQAILQAWKERWSDYQWAINMKRFFPRGATWDILNLAEALLEQAMIGPSPNPLILSYLKYAISSQGMFSCWWQGLRGLHPTSPKSSIPVP
uniref:Mediator of RNA polymerase II transcription subunit 24 n=1 Tax=Zonotrichia albicollis TaxID=44394 RepID=A0A8D2QEU8_ZONAL